MSPVEYFAVVERAYDELGRADYIENTARSNAVKARARQTISDAWISPEYHPLPGVALEAISFDGAWKP